MQQGLVKLLLVMLAGLLLGGGGMSMALAVQQSAPRTLAAPKGPPQKFTCGSEQMKCTCHGAEDCIGMKNSGQCSGAVTGVGSTGSCTWRGPKPSGATPMTMKPTAPNRIAAAPTGPKPYWCEFDKKGSVQGCACTNVSDCIKLSDSGMCGSKPIKDHNGGGTCGTP